MNSVEIIEVLRKNIEVAWRKFTFKVKSIEKPVEMSEVNEGMARYRIVNIYHIPDMKLIAEEYI